jgi:hypothetical protein
MEYFQNKNPDLGKFCRVLQCKMLADYMAIWSILLIFGYILWQFGVGYGYLVYFYRFGMLYQENSGNLALASFLSINLILFHGTVSDSD